MKLLDLYSRTVKTFYLETDEGTFFRTFGDKRWFQTINYDIHSEDVEVSPEKQVQLEDLFTSRPEYEISTI